MSTHPGAPLPRMVALKFARREDQAPHVVAKGAGELARRLLELAEQHHVPVRRDADLLELLAQAELGAEIPFELFHAVAVLLAELGRANQELASGAP